LALEIALLVKCPPQVLEQDDRSVVSEDLAVLAESVAQQSAVSSAEAADECKSG